MLRKLSIYFVLLISFQSVQSAEYTLSIQPLMNSDRSEVFFQPLADYLSAQSGETITLKTYRSFKSYWYHMKRENGFDMVLDAAHFVDYRIKEKNHKVLVKLPDTVTFTVATREDLLLIDIEELIPLKIASMVAPGVGNLRLKQMFPDPAMRPKIVPSYSSGDAVNHLREGRVDAVIIPTPLVARFPDLNPLAITDPMPHQGFTVSSSVPDEVVRKIRQILLDASNTKNGTKMLAAISAIKFVPTTAKTYDGSASLLDVMKQP